MGIYRHYKDDSKYRALMVVKDATNNNKTPSGEYPFLVIYVAVSGQHAGGIYARDFYEFHSDSPKWDEKKGCFLPRFRWVENDNA